MNTAELFTTEGKVTKVSPKNGESFTLDELQAFVGGNIEIIMFPGGREGIVINEEGRLLGLPQNELATGQWLIEFPLSRFPHNNPGNIVGNALIAPCNLIN